MLRHKILSKTTRINLSKEDKDLTLLLCKALNQPNASVKSTQKANSYYDVVIDTGISGPLHKEFMDQLCYDLLKPILSLIYKQNVKINVETISTLNKPLRHIICIENLHVDFLSGRASNSLIHCFQNYIAAKEAQLIDKKSFESSERIYAELSSLEWMKKYGHWEPKTKGMAKGVILLGKTKQNKLKKVYVKKIDAFDEALDYGIFKVAKACKVRVPKVKFAIANNHCYFFSTAVDKQKWKKPSKTYQFNDIRDYFINPNCYIDSSKLTVCLNRKPDGTFTELITMDKLNIAKIFLICLIFGLSDLHVSNLGIVISQQKSKKVAKLALVDFEINEELISNNFINQFKDKISIVNLVNEYVSTQVDSLGSNDFLLALLSHIEEKDYVEIIQCMQITFEAACDHSILQLDEILAGIDENDMKSAKNYYFEQWKANFNSLREIVESFVSKPVVKA